MSSALATGPFRIGWLAYFLFAIAMIGGFIGYGIGAPLCLLGYVFPPARRGGQAVFQRAIYLLMAVEPWLNARIDLRLPPGALTVSNHRSHLDSFLLLSRIRGVRFLCKHTLFYVPFLGAMMRCLRQIPVKRGKVDSYWRAMEQIREGLRAGDAIHVFPEMTRCKMGFLGTQEFHLAPFHIACQEKATVVPIAIVGSDEVWPKGRMGLSFRRPVTVQSLEPVNAAEFASGTLLAEEVRRRIEGFLEWKRAATSSFGNSA